MRTSRIRAAVLTAAVTLTLGMTAGTSQAGFLTNTLGYQYHFPTYDETAPFLPGDPFVVGAGIERSDLYTTAAGNSTDVATFDVSDTQVITDYYVASSWNSGAFNGFRLYDINGTVDAITNVTVDPSTNMAGFSSANVSFDADNIRVNWVNLSFDADTLVVLNVTFANGPGVTPTPVPPTALAAVLGLVGMAGVRLRRRAA